MSERHSAALLAAQLSQRCQTLLSDAHRAQQGDAPPMNALRHDSITLGKVLSKESNAISLGLKPPQESWKVPSELLRGWQSTVDKIGMLLAWTNAKATDLLRKELNFALYSLLEAIETFLASLSTLASTTAASSGSKRQDLLQATSRLWTSVEQLELVSTDEREALRKHWKASLGQLDDALLELEDWLGQSSTAQADDISTATHLEAMDHFDLDSDEELTEVERERAQAALTLLRLARLLLKRLITRSLADQLGASPPGDDVYKRLAGTANEIFAIFDDLAAALYGPQDLDELRDAAASLCKASQMLATDAVQLHDHDIVSDLASLDVSADKQKQTLSEPQWLQLCSRELGSAHARLLAIA
ncbi:uncharacterized protein L969DRAFT_94066 [Mixia osmundae IAM 14324]|uniref:Uncharacterized protein n=1 Tax=Mixia osmundae (strain CBS 9802 / IAM 14324 / JCM 22182 / KY 12970) TaxID=764103 RepID=G7E8Z6_MIXOS|nr:uncharacterized protein L969DRAFT_94066 [Mixia osmundae IAM 14324]KEI40250.1 hypothetical protein L969DRAFT_94066 [Mixia osmundae IAM 14324]GAA99614.1 hypothetical protein E5Q_06315 [Mixia osmundae IAM 14324]